MYTRITRHTGEPEPRLAIIATLAGLLAAAALVIATAGTANAGEHGVVVRYHPADLQDSAHAAALYERLEAAAERSCTDPGRRSLARIVAERACASEALERAVESVGSPVLSGIHEAKNGKTTLASR